MLEKNKHFFFFFLNSRPLNIKCIKDECLIRGRSKAFLLSFFDNLKKQILLLKTMAFHFQSKAFLLSSDKILRYQISFFFLWKLGSHQRKYGGYALNKCHILHLCENDELCLSSTHVVGHSVLENKPWRPNQSLRFFSVSFEFFLNTIEY